MAIARTRRIAVPITQVSIGSKPTASFEVLVKDLRTVLGKLGCEGCRSGLDKIVLEDIVSRRF